MPNSTTTQTSDSVQQTMTRVREAIKTPTVAPITLLALILTLWGMNEHWGWELPLLLCAAILVVFIPFALWERKNFPLREDVFTAGVSLPARSFVFLAILPAIWINTALFSSLAEKDLNSETSFLPHYHLTPGFFLAFLLALMVSALCSYGMFGHHKWSYYPKARPAVPIPSGVTHRPLTEARPEVDDARNRILAALHTADAYTGKRVFLVSKLQELTSLTPELFREALTLLEKDDVIEISNRLVQPMASINP